MNSIECDNIIDYIKNQQGEVRSIGVEFYQNNNGQFDNIIAVWKKAGYTANKVEWINYYPDKHFDSTVVIKFAEFVGLNLIRAWVSCVRPGKSVPWHQDIDDSMDEYLKLGELVRYTCFINKPAIGQVLMIEKDSYYMVEQGTVIKWNNFMDWHGASNCGFENQYLLHILGYK